MKKALILTNKMHLNTYVRMILDVLSNLRMPDRKCAKEMLGGPGSERETGGGLVDWWKTAKQPKTFPTKQKHFLSSLGGATRKVFIQLPTSGLESRRRRRITIRFDPFLRLSNSL